MYVYACTLARVQDVPAPIATKVIRWSKKPYLMMSYSYAAPGATGDHYQTMAQDIARKLYFAGEVVFYCSALFQCTELSVA